MAGPATQTTGWAARIEAVMARGADQAIVILVAVALFSLVIPYPHMVLNALYAASLILAFVILFLSMSIREATQFSSITFLVLLTTMLRLALNVGTTRMIIGKQTAPEAVVEFYVKFLSGNWSLGLMLVFILTVVQILYVIKGTDRATEVRTRFTLDAMPNTLMQVENDLAKGLIDYPVAEARRSAVDRKAQFYGALEGTSKFVRGEAFFGIILLLINLIGGPLAGHFKADLPWGEAWSTFAGYAIGDSFLCVVPSIIVGFAVAIVMARVASEDNRGIGQDILSQFIRYPMVLVYGGLTTLGIAIIPGLPTLLLLFLGTAMIVIGLVFRKAQQREELAAAMAGSPGPAQDQAVIWIYSDLQVRVGSALATEAIDRSGDGGQVFTQLVPELRHHLFNDLGLPLPQLDIRQDDTLPPDAIVILFKDSPLVHDRIPTGKCLVPEAAANLAIFRLEAEPAVHPVTRAPAAWIRHEDRAVLEEARFQVHDAPGVVMLHLIGFVQRYAHELLGMQDVQTLLDTYAQMAPKLVEVATGNGKVPLQILTQILQHLLREGVSIRDFKAILEALAKYREASSDPHDVAEHVRTALARQICFQYAREGRLAYYHVDPLITEAIKESIRRDSQRGRFLGLSPDRQDDIRAAMRRQLGRRPPTAQRPVLITEPEARYFLRRLVEVDFPECGVLSVRELVPELTLVPLGMISPSGPR